MLLHHSIIPPVPRFPPSLHHFNISFTPFLQHQGFSLREKKGYSFHHNATTRHSILPITTTEILIASNEHEEEEEDEGEEDEEKEEERRVPPAIEKRGRINNFLIFILIE